MKICVLSTLLIFLTVAPLLAIAIPVTADTTGGGGTRPYPKASIQKFQPSSVGQFLIKRGKVTFDPNRHYAAKNPTSETIKNTAFVNRPFTQQR